MLSTNDPVMFSQKTNYAFNEGLKHSLTWQHVVFLTENKLCIYKLCIYRDQVMLFDEGPNYVFDRKKVTLLTEDRLFMENKTSI